MAKLRRRQRANLRGWWRPLPFIAMFGATMFVFTWLHTQRLHNEYRANELAREIRRVNDRIRDLRGERYDLSRLERLDAAAAQPEHDLVPPRPGQVRILEVTLDELAALERGRIEIEERTRVTRSAFIRLGDNPPAATPVPDDSAVAHSVNAGVGASEKF